MKLAACIIVYNNADYLRAVLESIKELVDYFIIVDGKFRVYPGDTMHSTDGTLDIITEFGLRHEVLFVPAPNGGWDTQVAKRNAYMELLPVGDWAFVLDGDEIALMMDPEVVLESLKSIAKDEVRAVVKITNYSDRYRFFLMREGMRYKDYHWNIPDPETGENVISLFDAANPDILQKRPDVEGIQLIHMKHQRGQKVKDDKKEFYRHRMGIENPHIIRDMKKLNKAIMEQKGK